MTRHARVGTEAIESASRVYWRFDLEAATEWEDVPDHVRDGVREHAASLLEAALPDLALSLLDPGDEAPDLPDAIADVRTRVLALQAQLVQAETDGSISDRQGTLAQRQLRIASRSLMEAEEALASLLAGADGSAKGSR